MGRPVIFHGCWTRLVSEALNLEIRHASAGSQGGLMGIVMSEQVGNSLAKAGLDAAFYCAYSKSSYKLAPPSAEQIDCW